jgi:sugar (pentulose or hexulose) kinase
MPENLLAIDNGTQSVRALVFDPRGNLLYKSQIPIEPYFSPGPGLAEQDPDVFWKAVCQACQKIWEAGADKTSIAAVSLTCQRSTMINLDKDGMPLRPAIHWLDQRRAEGIKPLGGLWGAAFKLAGASETVAYLQAEADSNWLQKNQPDIWKATHKFLFLS